MYGKILVALLLLLPLQTASAQQESQFPQSAWPQACEDWDEWDKPADPFRIHGNTWYVGTCGIAAILITGDDGHVLIDSGTEAGAKVVLENIRKTGFDIRDVKYLLMSHEHFDHVGGMGVLRSATGAWIIPSEAAGQVLETGKAGQDDPQASQLPDMAPVEIYQTISDGGTIQLGKTLLTAFETPGHTPGAMSWQWESCEGEDCRTIVYADSLSPVSSDEYRFSDHPDYLAAYRESIARVAALDCDILLTPHPSASGMRDKLLADDLASGTNCREFAASVTARLDARLAQEAIAK